MSLFTCRNCGHQNDLTNEVIAQVDRIERAIEKMEAKIMGALDDDRAALADLATEIGAVLDRVAGTVQGGVSEADAEQLAADIKEQADRIRAALTPATPPADGSGDGSTPPADGSGDGSTPTA